MTTNITPPVTTDATSSLLSTLLDEVRTRRAERAQRKQLERELASYRTAAELDDLAAILDRHDDAAAEPVRRILDKVRAA